ncbi:MAG: hypothetical protein ACJ72D_23700, partial [Marmoricola sp.]
AANPGSVRKLAGIAFLLYCGLALIFIAAYLLALTAFPLPPGPPIAAAVSVALAVVAVTRAARRQR